MSETTAGRREEDFRRDHVIGQSLLVFIHHHGHCTCSCIINITVMNTPHHIIHYWSDSCETAHFIFIIMVTLVLSTTLSLLRFCSLQFWSEARTNGCSSWDLHSPLYNESPFHNGHNQTWICNHQPFRYRLSLLTVTISID